MVGCTLFLAVTDSLVGLAVAGLYEVTDKGMLGVCVAPVLKCAAQCLAGLGEHFRFIYLMIRASSDGAWTTNLPYSAYSYIRDRLEGVMPFY
jgi:hypothetical protein